MEKKQLFNNSLVGFHPEIFNPYLIVTTDIGDINYDSDFSIDQTVPVNSNFIDTYNKTPINSVGLLKIVLTYTNDNAVYFATPFAKGENGTYATINNSDFIYYITITDVNEVDKTIHLKLVSKNIASSDSDNTVVRLTTTINGLTNLNPGNFNETVTLTAEEYNALNKISLGEIFLLQISNVTFITFKVGDKFFRSNRDYIDANLFNRSLISFNIDLGENNQATFKGNVTKLMDFNNYLAKDNTTEYTPAENYNPATKKYVDDIIDRPLLDISNLLQKVKDAGVNTLIDVTNEIIDLFGSIDNIKNNFTKYRFVNYAGFVNFSNYINSANEFMISSIQVGRTTSVSDLNLYPNKSLTAIHCYYFKINDDNTVVNGYYDMFNITKDPDKPNQYLSNDGKYKYPYAAGIYFSEDNSQVNNHKYWGNYIIKKNNNNGDCTLVLISDCSELYNEVATNDLNVNRVFGIGGYGILNRFIDNGYPYTKPILIQAVMGHDTQGGNYRLHTSDWMVTPCIVKYQNKYYIAIRFGNNSNTVSGSYLNIIGMSANLLDSYIYLNCEEGQLYPTGVEVIQEGTYFYKDNLKKDRNNLLAKTDEDGYMSKEDKTKLDNTPVQKVLTESEYAALGTTPETDNVLYFITPD